MKNVAKKSTSLKPLCPAQNGVQERLPNDLVDSKLDVEDSPVEVDLCEPNSSDTDSPSIVVSKDVSKDLTKVAQSNDSSIKNSAVFNDNSNDELLDVSCVDVVDDLNSAKSPFDDDQGLGSRSSSPVVISDPVSNPKSDAMNGHKADHASDDEVIICDTGSPVVNSRSSARSSGCASEVAVNNSDKWRSYGPVCRVDNCEIFENQTEVEPDETPTKTGDAEPSAKTSNSSDKDVEVIEVDHPTPENVRTNDEKSAKRSGLKRIISDAMLPANDANQKKRSRLEAAEAEVLTSFVNAQSASERDNKVNLTSKQLNELILICIEDYMHKSHGSYIRQLKAEIEQLKKSRDEWKDTANKLRSEITLVQANQNRPERRRATVPRTQRRSVGCQTRPSTAVNRSPAKSNSSVSDSGRMTVPLNLTPTIADASALMSMSPSILPPASANLAATHRLRVIHQQMPRMGNSGLVVGPLKSGSSPLASGGIMPITIRPQGTQPLTNSSVTIDLTAEEDVRTKPPDAAVPNGLLGSLMHSGNMVLAPNSSANTYLLYAQPTRPPILKASDAAGVANLSNLGLSTSLSASDGYHSLPSLVSINNRHPGPVIQMVNMRPPPPLQSAPLRASLPLATSAAAPVSRVVIQSPAAHLFHHPAPLPATPASQLAPTGAKQIPPKPTLKLSRVSQGIVLSWNATIMPLQEDPSTYQLYAYQQGNDPPSSNLWKKVGNVKALALPMACTLTQFQVGNKYHFAVRAVDQFGRVGPFSEPGSIHLEGSST